MDSARRRRRAAAPAAASTTGASSAAPPSTRSSPAHPGAPRVPRTPEAFRAAAARARRGRAGAALPVRAGLPVPRLPRRGARRASAASRTRGRPAAPDLRDCGVVRRADLRRLLLPELRLALRGGGGARGGAPTGDFHLYGLVVTDVPFLRAASPGSPPGRAPGWSGATSRTAPFRAALRRLLALKEELAPGSEGLFGAFRPGRDGERCRAASTTARRNGTSVTRGRRGGSRRERAIEQRRLVQREPGEARAEERVAGERVVDPAVRRSAPPVARGWARQPTRVSAASRKPRSGHIRTDGKSGSARSRRARRRRRGTPGERGRGERAGPGESPARRAGCRARAGCRGRSTRRSSPPPSGRASPCVTPRTSAARQLAQSPGPFRIRVRGVARDEHGTAIVRAVRQASRWRVAWTVSTWCGGGARFAVGEPRDGEQRRARVRSASPMT